MAEEHIVRWATPVEMGYWGEDLRIIQIEESAWRGTTFTSDCQWTPKASNVLSLIYTFVLEGYTVPTVVGPNLIYL